MKRLAPLSYNEVIIIKLAFSSTASIFKELNE